MKKRSKTLWGSQSESKSKSVLLALHTATAFEMGSLDSSASGQNRNALSPSSSASVSKHQPWSHVGKEQEIKGEEQRGPSDLLPRGTPSCRSQCQGTGLHLLIDEVVGECAHLHTHLQFFTPLGRTCAAICHKQFLRGKAEPLARQL